MKSPENEVKPAPIAKTWQRTNSWPKGLLRHKSGLFYLRTYAKGKTRFAPLETSVLEVAKARAVDERKGVEQIRRATGHANEGIATMSDLRDVFLSKLEKGDIGVGIKERSKQALRESLRYIGKTWPDGETAFWSLSPRKIDVAAVQSWRAHTARHGTGFRPPGSKKDSVIMSGRSPRSFNKALYVLRTLLALAVDSHVIAGNPLVARRKGEITRTDSPRKPQLPERDKLAAMLNEVEAPGGRCIGAGEFLRVLYMTGCRKNEAAALRWQHVHFTASPEITIPGTKTDSAERSLPLSASAVELLQRIRARREANGLPVGPDAPVLMVREAQKSLDRACAKIGVQRLTHHDLRDAFATVCIESGVDIPTVARWLGHADGGALAMKVYGHLRKDHSKAQMMKVNF
jgi:integrase